ncbi:helix-turn-helix domain-containing protein [Oceanobacillus massiliensis]|uniref:helix-turn-helix domain-containing protein n=2 Tax=Bacillales TaxID=1385 RepID=UPI0002883926|nr:helix-turn-helix transcriptional regulator [Oceanobacillus massiliensis]
MKLNSFRDVIEDRFYNEIFNELSIFVQSNPDKLESKSNYVESPDEAELSDFEIKWVSITSSGGNEIQFDVILSAEIEIAETIKRNRETDGLQQWFRISCGAILEDGLQDFGVIDVSVYMKQKEKKENRLSEYLVPVISKEGLDKVAETFLKKYYPVALEKPMKVPARKIAKRMGLKVHKVHITQLGTIFGQIYFSDSRIKYYDITTGTYKKARVKRGTILIDPDVFFMRNIGSMNNTIIHECVHWDLHKNFFELEKLYNPEARAISCQVREGAEDERNRTPLDWMEWQANALAPRILMPEKQTRVKIEELIAKYQKCNEKGYTYTIFEAVVDELSNFFEVSKVAAKIRMIDLGYKQAIGVYNYIDEQYVPSHSFDEIALTNNQTFSISAQDILYEYATKPALKQLLDSGEFLYVNAHVCINDPKYIQKNDAGYATLTDYARNHIDECCLIFDVKAKANSRYGIEYYKEAVLFRSVATDRFIEVSFSESQHNLSAEEVAKKRLALSSKASEIAAIQRQLPQTFGDSVVVHMDRIGVSVEELAERADISSKTIQRIRNDLDYKPKFGTVVSICVGLQLPLPLSLDLVQKSGNVFMPGSQKHILYQMILTGMYLNPIEECNELMKASKFKVLSKEN